MVGCMKLTLLLLFALVTSPVLAQSKPEVIYWPAAKLGGYSATLKGRLTEKKTTSASEILSDLGNHKFEILRRDGSGAGVRLVLLHFLRDDVVAETDALIADVDRRSGDELLDLLLGLATEGAAQVSAVVIVATALHRSLFLLREAYSAVRAAASLWRGPSSHAHKETTARRMPS